ncbi:aa3-type cytochrome c oxidase subunit IV [Sphingomonas piscis]|uniref:Aa3-type cytochrome c oxidase subunit IV n=1 Tax=Sphingomonas piscis TaxID=2714943 RepID=A0A6G7YSA9_9SPHN|nr:aa3-type cytochrome c oxidase subunit IV [Sphingomonas piscis]QIK79611.1 aa3-type cytochrome c oxidase subunit IV [Sphingomonas piscis]
MAVDHSTAQGHGNDMEAHVRDYSKFTAMLKWGAIISAVIGFIVVFLVIS